MYELDGMLVVEIDKDLLTFEDTEVNWKVAEKILKRVKLNDGYCPCKQDAPKEDTICPCKKYRETHDCCCGLYIHKNK